MNIFPLTTFELTLAITGLVLIVARVLYYTLVSLSRYGRTDNHNLKRR